jgi:hypothetical protein
MAIDLNTLETTLTQLNADAEALGKIVNDAANAANGAEEAGTVTTRTGDVVKNVQRALQDIEAPVSTSSVETSSATAYTPIAEDTNKYKEMTANTAITVTIEAGVFVAGDEIEFEQANTGQVTFETGAGMTINSLGGFLSTSGQFAVATLKFKSATVATLYGDLA